MILLILKINALKWYNIYLLHSVIDTIKVISLQHFYLLGLRQDVEKLVRCCNSCQRTKWTNKKI